MIITDIDTLDLTASNIWAEITNASRPIEFSNRRRQRADSAPFVGSSIQPGEWDVIVKLPDSAARDALIATLDGDLNQERRLQATRSSVEVEAYAALRRLELPTMGLSARLTFEPTFPTWRAITAVTTSQTLTVDDTISVTVGGNTRVAPLVRIQPTAQRTGQTAAIGWKRRTRFQVENLSDETWYRHPVRIALGSTTAVVTAGRALASGNDVRVWLQGREVARTLVTWNTSASYVWVIIPILRPEATIDVDVMWHNADAGAPPVLAYPDLPPFDLANSSNALWRYQSTAGNGVWHLSSGTTTPLIDQDVPGAWHSVMTLANPDNTDDVSQAPYFVSGGSYSAPFHGRRGIAGGISLPSEGLADGVSLHHPCGIESVNATFSYRNDLPIGNASTPLGKFVILMRGTGAQGWDILFSRAIAQHASTTTVARDTYTPAAAVKHLALAVWPQDEIEVVENAAIGHLIEVRSLNHIDIAIDDSLISITTAQAETEVYEIATVISVDPGDGHTTANLLQLGAAGSTGDLDAPRLCCELDEIVILNGTTRTAELWDSALSAKVEDVPNFAVRAIRQADVLGVETDFPTHEWLTCKPNPSGVDFDISEVEMGTVDVDVLISPEWIL